MPTPDWREGDLLTALLDERAGLRDPMKVATALDELQAGTRAAPGALHERVHALLQPVDQVAPRRVRRLRLGRPRLLSAVGLAGAAAVLLLGVILAAGTGGSQTVSSLDGKDDVVTPSKTPPPTARAMQPVPEAPAATGAAPLEKTQVPVDRNRLQRYQLWMQLRVKDRNRLSQATQRAVSIVRGMGGYVASADVATRTTGPGRAQLALRVPIGSVQQAIARLSALGTIQAQHVAVQDIQPQLDNATKHVNAYRRSIAILQAKLQDPKLTAERRARLQTQLQNARHALLLATRLQKGVQGKGAYATVALALTTPPATAVIEHHSAPPNRFEQAARHALDALSAVAVAAIWVGILGTPVAIVAMLAWIAVRSGRRRSERRLLEQV